jgi:hypothetical protein
MTRRRSRASTIIVLAGVLVTGLLIMFWVLPHRSTHADASERVAALDAQVTEKEALLAQYRGDAESFQELQQTAETLDALIPYQAVTSAAEVISELRLSLPPVLERAASSSGVQMSNFADVVEMPSAGAPATLVAAQASMTITGPAADVTAFMDALVDAGELPTRSAFVVTPASEDPEQGLRLDGRGSWQVDLILWYTLLPPLSSAEPGTTDAP